MLLRRLQHRKCVAECCRHVRAPPAEPSSRCRLSTLAASAHPDYSSSGDERPSCAPSEIVQKTSCVPSEIVQKRSCAPREFVQKRSCALSSARVVQNLQCLKRRPDVALAYFKDTESVGFSHALSTYAEIIGILSSLGQSRMLFSLFREIVSLTTGGGGPEILPLMNHLKRTCTASDSLVFATNCLFTAYITCYDAQDTIGLIGELCRLGVVPSVWACNVLLKFAAERGGSETVLSAYDQMKLLRLTLDARALGIITRSLFREKKADTAFEVWAEMIVSGAKPDASGYLSFLTGLCDCGKIDLAYAILQEIIREGIQVDAMAYNKVMGGLCKEMRLEEAEKLLENKIRLGFTPGIYGYSYLIQSYSKEGNILKVLDHYQAMVSHGLKTDRRIVSYLLQCFTKVGMASHVTEHFQKFRDSGVHLDGVLYNIAMDAYCKLGNMDEAVKLLAQMKTDGLAPDRIHYTCLINGYCLKGDIPNAQQVFEEMLKANVKPDVVTYKVLASGFCRSGLVTEVFDLLDHMQDQGLEPNSLIYGDGFRKRNGEEKGRQRKVVGSEGRKDREVTAAGNSSLQIDEAPSMHVCMECESTVEHDRKSQLRGRDGFRKSNGEEEGKERKAVGSEAQKDREVTAAGKSSPQLDVALSMHVPTECESTVEHERKSQHRESEWSKES
ncbi:hypothetical protein ACQ4PT_007901 [Festuca glaucescens]